jgi:hypothetical protein
VAEATKKIAVKIVRVALNFMVCRSGKFIFVVKKAKLEPLCGHFTLIASQAQAAT